MSSVSSESRPPERAMQIPFNAPTDRPCKVWHEYTGKITAHALPVVDQYTIQGDLMARAILDDTPVPTPIEDAVANMRVIEAIFRSGRQNAWVAL